MQRTGTEQSVAVRGVIGTAKRSPETGKGGS
jgi:hypothetical protein